MSKNTVHFTISNPAISFLLHDCVKSPHNQIGFLFGEIDQKVSNVTTDSHADNETIEITVSVTASMPLSESEDLLFTRDGILNEPLLEIILGEFKKDVVGWYSFTRNQDLSPSICQLFLAHQFATYFSHIPKDLFLFFQMTNNIVFEENFTNTNKFLCTTGSDVSTPVELHIRQLGESTLAYNAHRPVTKQCETFDSVLNQIQWNNKDIVNSFETLQSFLCAKLNDQIDNLNCVPSTSDTNITNPSQQQDDMQLSEPDPDPIPDEAPVDDPMITSSTSSELPSSGRVPSRGQSPASPHMRSSHSPATAHVPRTPNTMRTRSPAIARSPANSSIRTNTVTSNGPNHTSRGPRNTPNNAPRANTGTPNNGTRPNNGTLKKSAPNQLTSASPKEEKVMRILSRKEPLPVNDSPLPPDEGIEGERARVEVDLDKSRDTYSSQEY
uniref:BRISC complex subunit FAM175B n=1 Tax=Cacopsylla melanoneura TaxID=428564 RepID=A0A8D8PSA0_9HEMI